MVPLAAAAAAAVAVEAAVNAPSGQVPGMDCSGTVHVPRMIQQLKSLQRHAAAAAAAAAAVDDGTAGTEAQLLELQRGHFGVVAVAAVMPRRQLDDGVDGGHGGGDDEGDDGKSFEH